MYDEEKKILTKRLLENLKILRMKLGLSQRELGEKVGVSRYTIAAFESHGREMSWNNFLALLMVFIKNKDTDELLIVFEIHAEELNEILKGRI